MAPAQYYSPIPIRAHLRSIELIADQAEYSSDGRSKYFQAAVSVDKINIFKSEKKQFDCAAHWEWENDAGKFSFHPSSGIKVAIYRQKNHPGRKLNLLGEQSARAIDFLENNETIELVDTKGSLITFKFKIVISLALEPKDDIKSFMEPLDTRIAGIDEPLRKSSLSAIRTAFQSTQSIMDAVSCVHPILKVSWMVLSTAYKAIEQAETLDDSVRELAENLREMLGVANEIPDLKVIKGTNNVIDQIGRTSLQISSLIYEYTRSDFGFTMRAIKSLYSDDLKKRVNDCHKRCNELKTQFDRRVGMGTNDTVWKTQYDIVNIEHTLKIIKDDQLADKIWKWLSAPDSSKNYNEAREKYQADTCAWFLNGERFHHFLERPDFIWIKGTAGCGKTILCSSIIAKIKELCKSDPLAVYAYLFFDGRDSQKDLQIHEKLIRSLILQLSTQCRGIPAALVELYGHGQQQASIDSLQDILSNIISGLHSVYIIIDSLDECIEREKTLRWVESIIPHTRKNLHMVVASRPERDITDVLHPLDLNHTDLAAKENQDIGIYLHKQLSSVKDWDKETKATVESALTIGAQGMFRWVALQLSELKRCSSPQAVINQLQHLPKGLYETYDQLLLRISEHSDSDDTKTFLRFLCFAARPLGISELACAVSVNFDREVGPQYAPSQEYWNPHDVHQKCSGFIVESNGKVKLSHFSVKEYLLSNHLCTAGAISRFHLSSEALAHSIISQTCLAYLLQFDALDSLNKKIVEKTSSPLALYAAKHWIIHAKSGTIDKSGRRATLILAKKLFSSDHSTTFTNWVRLWDFEKPHGEPEVRRTDVVSPLYCAASFGRRELVQYLLDADDVDVNISGGKYGHPLQAASAHGHDEIVKMLLDKGAHVNAQGGEYRNAFQAAASGVDTVMKRLIDSGGTATTQGGKHGTAVQAASEGGFKRTVKLLLDAGADVNTQAGVFGNALQGASYRGQYSIVEMLLENKANVNADGELYYGNAIQAAAINGHHKIIKQLIDRGANVNARGGQFSNALQAAAAFGCPTSVELLLDEGAKVNEKGGFFGYALQAASYRGKASIVRLLLERGANINAQGGTYGTALQAASERGHESIVQLLLEKGANVDANGGEYGNALQGASYRGRVGTVEILLAKGVNVNAKAGRYYGDALQAAAIDGHMSIIQLLINSGADLNAQGGRFGNALRAAAMKGNEDVVKLLLARGVDVNARGEGYGTAIQVASERGHDAIVTLLSINGAKLDLDI